MKQIEPIDIWQNGIIKTAVKLQIQGTSVTLGQSASFFWQLYTEENHQIASGNLGISGDQYKAWNNDDYIYKYVATNLNLTLVSGQ